ncbi:MAG: hypothetical protein PF495_09220, partial [Spirochaetales bacterium]|nr:hypothetical protein [Spirochaetales bacterium]
MSQEIKQGWSSLAQQFDASPEYVGHFGWLCGYSADVSFLDDAAERFTRLGPAQRTYLGRIALAVMLDPGSPKVSILDAPGVAHLPIKSISGKPFRLLHAKVALLGFRHTLNHEDWRLRLIVSTGNWTRQTLEDSLDLVWCIDITSSDLTNAHHNLGSKCADIKAATDLMRWLEERFDSRLLNARSSGRFSETKNAREEVDKWLNLCIKKANGQPRFIDNRKRSLLNTLPGKIKELGNTASHNYLAMGSGFYEAVASDTAPDMPGTIIQTLQENGLLTKNPQVDLYVNPQACQAIAESVSLLHDKGIKVREAAVPKPVFGDRITRGLHAKFLFSTSIRHNLYICSSPWIYLGYGNLTNPGFAQKM